ncbi:hypothetical protein VAR608DRAFT_1689 [Variovorax sp. HW608]|uniref:hypothetical protein n=1 Tax=Variovorax sp. HW608 TaxID=1034889 RepID=UPI00081FC968|nr:hypothetical protein [Variovorax sp. HW608]SCK21879.1 hypothetical protein VAR608DRAFT_1689 [Variovorax sp. HW608]
MREQCFRLFALPFCVFILFGCAPVIREIDFTWKIAFSNEKMCNPINWRYLDEGMLFEKLRDSSARRAAAQKFSATEGFHSFPYSGLPAAALVEKRREFNRSAIVEIKKTPEGWEAFLHGGNGILYARTAIRASSEYVGCDSNNNLTLREFSITSGSEGTRGTARATERIISRLDDGSLAVNEIGRYWARTMNSPPKREAMEKLRFRSASR